ncbi:MAG TPA: response regulator transcription factor [Opitutaceae bacterium]|nr:response regulator transcription factor [Opitutaceae bacterium]
MVQSPSALIIDDEAHVRLFLRTLLEAAGAGDIREAANGADGAMIYAQEPTDIVLLDLNMPGQTGLDTLSQITGTDPDATVIIVTSQHDRETVMECQRRGAAGFLLKSRPKDELLEALQEFFDDGEKTGG